MEPRPDHRIPDLSHRHHQRFALPEVQVPRQFLLAFPLRSHSHQSQHPLSQLEAQLPQPLKPLSVVDTDSVNVPSFVPRDQSVAVNHLRLVPFLQIVET